MLTQRASGNKVLLGSTSATAQRLKSLSGCIIIPHVGSVLVSQMPSNWWIYNSNQNFWIVLNRLFGTWSNTSPPISTNCISLSLNAHFVIRTPRKSSIAKTPILGPISPIYIHKICRNLVYIPSSCTRVWLNIMTEHYLFVSDFGPRSGLSATTKSFLMWAVFGPSKPGHSRTSWHSAETYFLFQSFKHHPGKRRQAETDWPETDFKNLLTGFIIAAVTKGIIKRVSKKRVFLMGRYGNVRS